jgi:hypothetical protein
VVQEKNSSDQQKEKGRDVKKRTPAINDLQNENIEKVKKRTSNLFLMEL